MRAIGAVPGRQGCALLVLNFSLSMLLKRPAAAAVLQMGPGAMGTNDPASRAAINEAEQLLAEVAALL